MKLHFAKVNPTENMTVFIRNQLPRSCYIEIANKIMAYGNVYAEQVGFIEKAQDGECVRLQMMGGEFCANATRALAALLAYEDHKSVIKKDRKMNIPIEVSGMEKIIYCHVEETNDPIEFISSIDMPLHKNIKNLDIEIDGQNYHMQLVEFPGIVHVVLKNEKIKDKTNFFLKVKEKLKDLEYEALGMIFYDEANTFIEPLIYVKETESLVFERGCGSGTAALGVALSYEHQNDMNLKVNQPGGVLEISTIWKNNTIEKIYLKGRVKIVAEGIVYISRNF
ncbi:diaminopimelate epimerase [Anaerophilus nitritogenes]|uniref:diaminopimelate epimerase n=1 Tax=Anaerophilus nitritogenes TaxID=2498136 RepID=UPI00101BF984|nr:diaminopimelate epimerase [Anaerophilus nitritogenes]